jgi:hypothetical protein
MLALACAGGSAAQTSKRTYRADSPFDYSTGVRATGMGETGVADNTDPGGLFFNPANVVAPPHVYLRGSYWEWFDNPAEKVGGVGGSWAGSWGSRPLAMGVDFTAATLDYSVDTVRTIYFPEGTLAELPDENFWSLTAGAGILLRDRWDLRLGVAARRYWESGGTRDGLGFDAGTTLAYRAVASGWRVTPAAAMAFTNLGPPVEETDFYIMELPARFNYGVSVRIESPAVRLYGASPPLVAVTCNLDGVDRFYGARSSWGFGSEFSLAEVLFFRVGAVHDEKLHDRQASASTASSLGVGLGLPVNSFRLRLDYAKLPNRPDTNHYGVWAAVSF